MIRRAGELRYRVTVKRPREGNQGSRGEKQGDALTIYANWPCSIDTLSGSEVEKARQMFASATVQIKGYTDPQKPIKEYDFIVFGSRVFNVGFVNDVDQLGLQAELLCGEKFD